jgi:hypothetical protein
MTEHDTPTRTTLNNVENLQTTSIPKTDITNISEVSKKKKSKKNKRKRCNHKECKKKLSFMDIQMACKCKLCFCAKHRPLTMHICTANHVKLNQEYLIKNNPVIMPSKLNMV